MTVPVDRCMQGWFPLAGLPWITPCYARGVQAPVQPLRHQFPSSSIGNEFNKYLVGAFYALHEAETNINSFFLQEYRKEDENFYKI